MKYRNKELLTNWADNIDKVAELTKHSTTRTAKKTRLSELLNTVSTGKILGAKERKELNGKKVILTSNSKANPVPAFLECLGSHQNSCKGFLRCSTQKCSRGRTISKHVQ